MTLIELMMVVLIIGLLAAAAAPVLQNALRQSRGQALAADTRKLYTALMSYHADHGAFPSEADFNTATMAPLSTEGYFPEATSYSEKLLDGELTAYLAPDEGGADQQVIAVARLALDPTVIAAVAYTDLIEDDGGWIDGVFVITEEDLEDADDL